jgi:hypothetical protein
MSEVETPPVDVPGREQEARARAHELLGYDSPTCRDTHGHIIQDVCDRLTAFVVQQEADLATARRFHSEEMLIRHAMTADRDRLSREVERLQGQADVDREAWQHVCKRLDYVEEATAARITALLAALDTARREVERAHGDAAQLRIRVAALKEDLNAAAVELTAARGEVAALTAERDGLRVALARVPDHDYAPGSENGWLQCQFCGVEFRQEIPATDEPCEPDCIRRVSRAALNATEKR